MNPVSEINVNDVDEVSKTNSSDKFANPVLELCVYDLVEVSTTHPTDKTLIGATY